MEEMQHEHQETDITTKIHRWFEQRPKVELIEEEPNKKKAFETEKNSHHVKSSREDGEDLESPSSFSLRSEGSGGAYYANGFPENILLRCKYCPFSTDQSFNLMSHLKVHAYKEVEGEDFSYSNPPCSEVSRQVDMHGGKEPYDCTYPQADAYDLQSHLRFYTSEKDASNGDCSMEAKSDPDMKTPAELVVTNMPNIDKKTFKCPDCSYTTIRSSDLKSHGRVHTDERNYKCVICAYATKHSSALRVHLRIHTGEKPFGCPECPYSTARSSDLKTHSHIHDLEKSFKCVVCPYSTKHSSALRVHLRIHTGEKPFRCAECPYTTARSSDLTKHVRIHSGEKGFKCLVCSYSTKHSSALRVHLRIHSGERKVSQSQSP